MIGRSEAEDFYCWKIELRFKLFEVLTIDIAAY
jgi:hypothetical protein